MKHQLFLSLGLVLTMGLGGCEEQRAALANPSKWLDLPALPIVQNAVFTLYETLAPHKNPLVMDHLCALAKGELTQEHINTFIQQQGGSAQQIPPQGHPLSLLVNGDRQVQVQACAAYLAITVLSPLNLNSIAVDSSASALPDKPKTTEATPAHIDQAKLLALLPGKLAIAHTNADFFTLIAAELQRRPGLTPEQFHQLSMAMFAHFAPNYLQRIKEHTPAQGTQYRVLKLDADQFMFISSNRTLFAYDFSGLKLQQNGVNWFGDGKLLGKSYFLKTAYLPDSTAQLNGIPSPPESIPARHESSSAE